MTVLKKLQQVAYHGAIGSEDVAFKVMPDSSAYCFWVKGKELHFARFRDFEWESINSDSLVLTADGDIRVESYCLDVDSYDNCHFLYAVGSKLFYLSSLQNTWSNTRLIHKSNAKSFSVAATETAPANPFFGFIYGVEGAQDRLVIDNVLGTCRHEIQLTGNLNGLLQLKKVGGKLYVLWVETESYAYASSSSSHEIDTSSHSPSETSESSFSSSESSVTKSSHSSSKSSITLSESTSSSTEGELYSVVKYVVYDIISDTFDTPVALAIDSTETNGEILSFDFASIL